MTDVLDPNVLDELRASVGDDREFFAELVDELLADAPRQVLALRAAAAAGDAETARRAAHTLKGNGRTFGADELATLAQELEAAAAAGDVGVVLARVDELDGVWGRAEAALVVARDATP